MRLLPLVLIGCLVGAPAVAATTYTAASSNWAGYAVETGGVTGAAATWTVPAVTTDGYSSTWVGIGGIRGGSLLQVGTEQNLTPAGPRYFLWWEALPQAQRPVLEVSPGDTVHASVRQAGSDLWRVRVIDQTTGQRFTRLVRYRLSRTSAEWVEEDPTQVGAGLLPLADFGSVTFQNATVSLDGRTYSPAQLNNLALTLGSPYGQAQAAPGPLSSSGGFTVQYAAVPAPVPTYAPPQFQVQVAPYPPPDTARLLRELRREIRLLRQLQREMYSYGYGY
jgi:hypothetical protein